MLLFVRCIQSHPRSQAATHRIKSLPEQIIINWLVLTKKKISLHTSAGLTKLFANDILWKCLLTFNFCAFNWFCMRSETEFMAIFYTSKIRADNKKSKSDIDFYGWMTTQNDGDLTVSVSLRNSLFVIFRFDYILMLFSGHSNRTAMD